MNHTMLAQGGLQAMDAKVEPERNSINDPNNF